MTAIILVLILLSLTGTGAAVLAAAGSVEKMTKELEGIRRSLERSRDD